MGSSGKRTAKLAAGLGILTLLSGCAGHFDVRPATQASAPGFRYYLPEPYLVVTNMSLREQATTVSVPADSAAASAGAATPSVASDNLKTGKEPDERPDGETLTSKIIWLPDLATPYTITTRGVGIGSFKGSIQLANGWMLTGVNQESDAKVADTLSALSGLVGNAASVGTLALAPRAVHREKHPPFLLMFRIDTKANTLTPVGTEALKRELAAALAGGTSP